MADVETYELVWASGGVAIEPSEQRQSTGFTSGPADPDEVNWLFRTQQERHNELAELVRSLTIFDDMTIYVPADQPTIQDALNFLNDKTIAPPAIVRIMLPAGEVVINQSLTLDHPQGNRIHLIGADLTTAWPGEASIVANQATTESTLRSIFPTVIKCVGADGLQMLNHSLGRLQNILFIGDGSAHTGLRVGSREGVYGRANVHVDSVWVHGFGTRGAFQEIGSQMTGERLGVSFCGEGIRNARSQFRVSSCRICRNTGVGLWTINQAFSEVSGSEICYNGGPNQMDTNTNSTTLAVGIKLRGTVTHANTIINSSLVLVSPDTNEVGTEYYAGFSSYQQITTPVGTPSYSPAAGATGNNNANTVVL